MTEPVVEQLQLPKGYGEPSKLLEWSRIRKMLEEAQVYWVASVRPNGHPHLVPKDGIWLDHTWYYSGDDTTVHHRNLAVNPAISMHIGEGIEAVIVEGTARKVVPERSLAQEIAEISNKKYAHYGLENTADSYTEGIWTLKADRVLAWIKLWEDATRFRFD